MKTVNIIAKDVQLMVDDEKLGEAVASISLNPNVAWLKMVITDDKPNANAMRIPKEEFGNVLKTAVYMPIKMARGNISEGHDETFPLGSIAHLVEKDDHVVALAALWTKERPEDIKYLKERYTNGQSIDVSWELNYDVEASQKDESGILELRNIEMNAVTIVGLPSYMGRTPVTAIASKEDHQGDNNTMDTINREDHDKIVAGLNKEINELKDELKAATAEIEKLRPMEEELAGLKSELDDLKPKYEELATFKATIDAEKEKEEKLAAIRSKFAEAGLEATDEYFAEREEKLLAMSDEQVDFFIQELVAFKQEPDEEDASAEASISITSKLPDVKGKTQGDVEKKDVVEFLHSLDKSK